MLQSPTKITTTPLPNSPGSQMPTERVTCPNAAVIACQNACSSIVINACNNIGCNGNPSCLSACQTTRRARCISCCSSKCSTC